MKRIVLVVACAAVVGWAGAARAQGAPADAAGPRRVELGGKAGMWIPMDDAEDSADASLGVRVHGAYWVVPAFAIGGAIEWVFVSEDEGVDDLTYYGIGLTGLVTMPGSSRVKPFGELTISRYTLDADSFDESESDIGFRLAGGATLEMSPGLLLMGDLAYSTVDFDFGLVSVDAAALILEVGVAARL